MSGKMTSGRSLICKVLLSVLPSLLRLLSALLVAMMYRSERAVQGSVGGGWR